jgi:subtilisin family serine protease
MANYQSQQEPEKNKRATNGKELRSLEIVPPATHGNRERFTGKKILTLNKEVSHSFLKSFERDTSLKIVNLRDFATNMENYHAAFTQGDGIYFDTFKVAVINSDNNEPERVMKALKDTDNKFQIEPERYVYICPHVQRLSGETPEQSGFPADSEISTWGIRVIKGLHSKYTGKGINIAVLDTGLNLNHPDFARLTIQSKSFIENEPVEDGNGHGTHCSGIAVGAINQTNKKRYGVAMDANLFIGKVLSNVGNGTDTEILAGIEWALQNNCKVISMSLGSKVGKGETFSPAYEQVAQTALQNGCLIIAAAGNESQREFGYIMPVVHPANCPSIMAVGALTNNLSVAKFSCAGLNGNGGNVDIAAPGVEILSSWKGNTYHTISGTSMATPFVAGVAATYWEAFPNDSANEIWTKLTKRAFDLSLEPSDVGAGLVQCIH